MDAEKKFRVWKLEILDKSKGFAELLQQLSICVPVSDKEFEELFLKRLAHVVMTILFVFYFANLSVLSITFGVLFCVQNHKS